MTVSLTKGGNVSLAKSAPGMTHAVVGLGWNPRTTDGKPFDLDGSVLLLGADGKVRTDADFIFYNNKTSADGSVAHQGDNLDGAGDGDDEQIKIDLAAVPADVTRIVVVASINDADAYGQNFGQVSDAYVRVFNGDAPNDANQEARFDLGEDAATETALVFAEVYRNGAEWKLKAVAQGYSTGLGGVASDFGISAG